MPRPIRRIVRAFANHQNVIADHVSILATAIAESPQLLAQFHAAIRSDQLRELSPLPEMSHAGGAYDGHLMIISLPLRLLRPDNQAEVVFVLGHELQHAQNNPAMRATHDRFVQAIEHEAQNGCNYTQAIGQHLAYQRIDEASANLAGWNAYVGYLRLRNPHATLAHAALSSWRSEDFLTETTGPELYAAREGLTINPDLSIDPTPANIEAVARHYFDKDADHTKLGYFGTSDYLNQYGAEAVSQAAAFHRYYNADQHPSAIMIMNASELGLSRKIMEENGIDLQGQPSQPYLDCSTTPPRLDFLHHTIATHRHVPIDYQAQAHPAQPDPSIALAQTASGPSGTRVPPLRLDAHRKRPSARRGVAIDPREP